MNRIEALSPIKLGLMEQNLYKIMLDRLSHQEEIAAWSQHEMDIFNNLPKNTDEEKLTSRRFVSDTAKRILENPSNIAIAGGIWKRGENNEEEGSNKSDSFYDLVKQDVMEDVGKNWKDIPTEQLAGFVRVYAGHVPESKQVDGHTRHFTNDGPARDFAKDVLSSYFKGPTDKPDRPYPRVVALYNFLLAVLDLAEEDQPLHEGMKIAMYGTDILPIKPGLVEQLSIASLPSLKEENSDLFKKILVIEYVTKQVIMMNNRDLAQIYIDNVDFTEKDTDSINAWNERTISVAYDRRNRNGRGVKVAHSEIRESMNGLFACLNEPLTSEKKQELIAKWPRLKIVLNESEPLNQKLREKLPLLASGA